MVNVMDPVKGKRFRALKDMQIGTGHGFMSVTAGQVYEADFRNLKYFRNLVGAGVITDRGLDQGISETAQVLVAEAEPDTDPEPKTEEISADLKQVVYRLRRVKTFTGLNKIVNELSDVELGSSEVQAAVIYAKGKLSK